MSILSNTVRSQSSVIHPSLLSYWVCPEGERFEASVTWNDKQVTRCILTPPAEQVHTPVPGEPDPEDVDGIWIVKHNEEGVLESKLMETHSHPPRQNEASKLV